MVAKNTVKVVIGDISKLTCDCIVNAANTHLHSGAGVCGAIHAAAGPELQRECERIGGCPTGDARITKGYRLPAKYVIHAVGPIYDPRNPKIGEYLASCYTKSLDLAVHNDIHSIAFPSISTGIYGYPLSKAVPIAVASVSKWLSSHGLYGMEVVFCCYNVEVYNMYVAAAQAAGLIE